MFKKIKINLIISMILLLIFINHSKIINFKDTTYAINSNYSNINETIIINLKIGSNIMYINNTPKTLEVSPQIIQGRAYLPIRYILEPLGANLLWDPDEKKVTIILNDIKIELWIGKNLAKVNNNYKLIDPDNPKVTPLIINGRTMLPIRFVAENLGCKVNWDSNTQTITIIYEKKSEDIYIEDLIANSFGYPLDMQKVVDKMSFGIWYTYKTINGYHLGVDLETNNQEKVYAIADGYIKYIRLHENKNSGDDFHAKIIIEHKLPDGRYICSVYYHLDENKLNESIKTLFSNLNEDQEIILKKPIKVKKGDLLGTNISIKPGSKPHLHLGIRSDKFDESIVRNTTNGYYGYAKFTEVLSVWWSPEDFIEIYRNGFKELENISIKIKFNDTNIRCGPDLNYEKIAVANMNQVFVAFEKKFINNYYWYHIWLPSIFGTAQGWIRGDLVEEVNEDQIEVTKIDSSEIKKFEDNKLFSNFSKIYYKQRFVPIKEFNGGYVFYVPNYIKNKNENIRDGYPEGTYTAWVEISNKINFVKRKKETTLIKIGLVTDVGGRGDKSYNDSALRGLEEWGAGLKMVTGVGYQPLTDDEYKKSIQDEAPDLIDRGIKKFDIEPLVLESKANKDYVPNLKKLADEGCKLVIGVGFMLTDAIKEVAPQYPNTYFMLIDGVIDPAPPNVVCYTFKEHEGSFLVGALVGQMTKKNKVGFVGGMNLFIILEFEAGYRAGVKTVNTKCEVLIGYTGNFTSADDGQKIAKQQFDAGADIVYHASGACGIGVIKEAQKRGYGYYAIGCDYDQDYIAPGSVLTSMVKHYDYAVYLAIKSVLEGKFISGIVELGVKEGGVGLSPMKYTKNIIPSYVLDKIEMLKNKIINGEIIVPKTREEFINFNPFENIKNGKLKLNSDPSGASIFINEEYKGKTPITIELQPGEYKLTLTMNGYKKYTKTIIIESDKTLELLIILEKENLEKNNLLTGKWELVSYNNKNNMDSALSSIGTILNFLDNNTFLIIRSDNYDVQEVGTYTIINDRYLKISYSALFVFSFIYKYEIKTNGSDKALFLSDENNTFTIIFLEYQDFLPSMIKYDNYDFLYYSIKNWWWQVRYSTIYAPYGYPCEYIQFLENGILNVYCGKDFKGNEVYRIDNYEINKETIIFKNKDRIYKTQIIEYSKSRLRLKDGYNKNLLFTRMLDYDYLVKLYGN